MRNLIVEDIILKDHLTFHGSIDQLKEKLQSNGNSFITKWSTENTFKFMTKWSIGTLFSPNEFPYKMDGISGLAELKQVGENRINISLTTEIRIELFFYLIIMTVICLVGLIMKPEFPTWVLALHPIGLVWFWVVYRVQEQLLFNKLKKVLSPKSQI